MNTFLLAFCCLLALNVATPPTVLIPGRYVAPNGHIIYVGVESDGTTRFNDFYDPVTQRVGDLKAATGYRLVSAISEVPRVITTQGGALGVSLYYSGSTPKPTVVLIHGNEAETREMGAIIPYFVLSGVNAISYDQRGSGQSAGSFLANGPPQRAADVAAIYDAFNSNGHVDRSKIGVYGFSNGGWTAPIASELRPLAFIMLGSTATESIRSNADYEITQLMKQRHFGASDISQALDVWHAIESALATGSSWDHAKQLYQIAKTRPWFETSLLPIFVKKVPPSATDAAALRKLLFFDPTSTLRKVTTPTLALYGALDREVDVPDSIKRLKEAFLGSGLRDYTIVTFPKADHLLIVSKTGYVDEEPVPNRYVDGYPRVLIDWLRRHLQFNDR